MAPLRTNLVNHFLACYSSSSSPDIAVETYPRSATWPRQETPHSIPQARPAKLTPRARSISTNKNTHPRASNITLSTSEGSDQERRALSPRKQRVAKAAPEQRQTPRAPGAPNGFSVAPVIISVPEPTDGWSAGRCQRPPATQPSGVPIPSGPPVSAAAILQALRTPAPVQSGGTRPPETQTAPVAAASIGTAITGTAESASAAASETHLTARTCSTAYCKTRLPDIRAYPYKNASTTARSRRSGTVAM
ncbi:hypothetical protein A0H81_07187 [Grifola frondosa]|uniref:Uncharacterized protein n=1 Tax=Grifola frondosa TaxID=5627 RepID=A0A1C7M7R4_GRIFR|nr:hypothetical protein A0H81_07187 [Grifola frondosa]